MFGVGMLGRFIFLTAAAALAGAADNPACKKNPKKHVQLVLFIQSLWQKAFYDQGDLTLC